MKADVLSQVFDSLPSPMMIVRLDGGIERLNAAAASLLDLGLDAHLPNLLELCRSLDRGATNVLERCAGSAGWQPLSVELTRGGHAGLRVAMTGRGLVDAENRTLRVLLLADRSDNVHFEEHRRLIRLLNSELAEQQRLREQLDEALNRERQLHEELVHRMKNNLSMLSVIIRSRKAASRDPNVNQALSDIEGRIRSIALVHEMLDGTRGLEVVEASDLLGKLCATMRDSVAPPNVEVTWDLEPSRLHITDATPLCLLVNELVTNAMKHGFPQGGPGRVTIGLRRLCGALELRVTDDGAGMTSDAGQGTGSRIVEALAMQMDAELSRETGPGVHWRLLFKPADPDGGRRSVGDAA
ncbi:sensor histidine kinase [Roseitranquillus sediminis]|uniref:sensor histidine kinase n=1 Tax=Roseitranquillus sediminis TaxID=2809051 RepID=UPI001D0CB90B|nr:sensor histidine kinase [Roseitranquillus sediminis]MBM9595007.1 sensor histidine kinase [Roseitranquillus sediminis]